MGKGRKSGSGAASTTASTTRTNKQRKEVLESFEENISKTQKLMARLAASLRSWALSTATGGPQARTDWSTLIGEASVSTKEIEPRLVDLVSCVSKLKTTGFVPTSAPRAPKFAVGEIVKVDDEWMPKYTKSGIYKVEELSELEITAIGDKEVLTKTKQGREVLVRAIAHLEAVALAGA